MSRRPPDWLFLTLPRRPVYTFGNEDLYQSRRRRRNEPVRRAEVRKNAVRVETYGTVDECNAVLGVALTQIGDAEARAILTRIQGELFEVGADLATPPERGETVPRVRPEATARLEAEIDRFEEELEPLRHFILPGGSAGGATLHQARAVCRRAERYWSLWSRWRQSARKSRAT